VLRWFFCLCTAKTSCFIYLFLFGSCGAGHCNAKVVSTAVAQSLAACLVPSVAAVSDSRSPSHRNYLSMIRRNPTLITMSDADVQDVRNMLAKKQAEGVKSPNSNAKAKGKQGLPLQSPVAAVHITDATRRREAREERLGL
jgi:hypothetical protein